MNQEQELKKFDKAKSEVSRYIEVCNTILIANDTDLGAAKQTLKQAAEAKKLIDVKREELVKPHLEAQRSINEYAKSLTLPLEGAIAEGKGKILSYEQDKERKRIEELRKLEEERRAREEAARAESIRVENLKNKLNLFGNRTIEAINKTQSIAEIDQVECSLKLYSVSETSFQEYAPEAAKIKEQMLLRIADQRAFLIQREEQKKEAERLNGIALEQAKLKSEQEAEARKLEIEKEKIAREQRLLEERAMEEEARKKAEAEKAIRDQQEAKRMKELEAQKSKNIRKNWVFEILDESILPREFLKPDEEKIKIAISSGVREIDGVVIFEKETVVIR